MGQYTYNETVVYAAQDNKTYAAKRTYKIAECGETLIANNASELWCNNLCSQDEKYCNPFVKGDKIYFQFRNDTVDYWKILPKIYNGTTGEIIASNDYISTETGTDENDNYYLNIIVNTGSAGGSDFPLDCWYMKVYLFECDVNEELYSDCVTAALAEGKTQEEAEFECSVELCGSGVSEIITEPYCLHPCDETLLIEGVYPVKDCEGNYYGVFQDDYFATNSFKFQVRIVGELIKQSFNFETTIVNRTKQKSTKKDVYQLTSHKIPPYVAERIANCFNAQELYIDGVAYDSGAQIEKNNEFGQMWIINTQVTKNCEQLNFECES